MRDDLRNEVAIRITIIFLVLMICIVILIGRLAYIQIFQFTDWNHLAQRQHQKVLVLQPKRGTIYDRNREVLAMSIDAESVYAHPRRVRNAPLLAQSLAPILHIDVKELHEKLTVSKSFVWLQRKISPQQASALRAFVDEGIGLQQEGKRYYPKRELAANVLGFVGTDNQGLAGLEYFYDTYMKGEPQQVIFRRDAHGRNLPLVELPHFTIPRGFDLILTLDENIQYIVEKELAAQVLASKARNGIAIIMNPHTGEILALAEYPSFNPNSFGAYQPHQRLTKGITDGFEPGSTFKVVVAAAALEEGLVKPDELIFAEYGAITVGGKRIKDYKPFGWLTFQEILEKSSNVGAIKIAQRLGEKRFYHYMRQFGFGQKTGIDLPGEIPGLLRPPEEWSRVSIGALTIGQEILVTPLQLITAFSVIANGGMLVKPYVVQRIERGEEVREDRRPQVIRRVISPAVSQKLRLLLQGVVEQGTGKLAAVEGYKVAGKTGTAQKFDPWTKTYSNHKSVVSFVGFLPVEDPQVTILVVLDEPQGQEVWGGTLAAPVFSRIAQQVMHYLQIPGQNSQVVWLEPEEPTSVPEEMASIQEETPDMSWTSLERLSGEWARLVKASWSNIQDILAPTQGEKLTLQP